MAGGQIVYPYAWVIRMAYDLVEKGRKVRFCLVASLADGQGARRFSIYTSVEPVRTMKLIGLLLAASAALASGADTAKTVSGASYSEKKFYFAAWGGPGSGTEADQQARLAKLAGAGITDLLPGDGPERLKELIRLGKPFGIRIHAWHWMMNVGSAKECQEHPDWYSVNRQGQNCRDFHPYVGYYWFLSPFSPGAREYVKKGVRELARVEGLASGTLRLHPLCGCHPRLGTANALQA